MSYLQYVKPIHVSLKSHPTLDEKWLQERIAEDPSLLGLGDLVLRDKERIQPTAGRLDLLLQDAETKRRFEVEIQLGKSDEAHIIRTIEYWDIERRRYPQYDHTAVIVAEDITTRFLNVIQLFNGHIPLVAVQLSAVSVGDSISLVFTKVLDETTLGLVDDDEEVATTTDRAWWEIRSSSATVAMTDAMLELVHLLDSKLELKYNKFYIGLAKDGQPNKFVTFRPKKGWLRLEPRLEASEETTARLESSGLDVMDYDSRWGRYRLNLAPGDIEKHREFLIELLRQAYENAS